VVGQRIWHETGLVQALADGAVVVTGSERLARAVQFAYAHAQRRAGLQVWERPRVLSWQAFLVEQFSACQDEVLAGPDAPKLPSLLSPVQAEALWERVVRTSETADGLLQPAAAAQLTQEAWLLSHAYRLGPAELAESGAVDAEQFIAWAADFQSRCDTENWLDLARLPDQLARWIGAGQLEAPAYLVFAGFDEWTPQQERLLQSLRNAGSKIERFTIDVAELADAGRVSCDDSEHELLAAAQWAGALLERDPDTRIGIVVRDLSASREKFARILDQVLCPSACTGKAPVRPYNLSLGRPLADWPAIQDALLFLRILQGRFDFDVASQLLCSPFLRGAESEYAARAGFELSLRDGAENLLLTRFVGLAREWGEVPELVAALDSALEWRRAQVSRQLPSIWARAFAALLQAMGWPGERVEDSVEYQTVAAFRDALGELTRLDTLLGAVDIGDAVRRLASLMAQRTFQPAAADVPIQVLGMLETAGLQFDHLWITGLSDDVWPASPRPNPLIPVSLQRRYDMPHASARRELEFARRITARLLASAPDVLVSVPQRDADQELRISPLIAPLPEIDLQQLAQRSVSGYARFLQVAAPTLELFEDLRGPVLQSAGVSGGTGILKSQAACPFQAFARYRLGAEPMRVPGPGLDPAERGSLLHEVMYRMWGELGDHATLVGLEETALQSLVSRHVSVALAVMQAKRPEIFSPRFLALEQQRLVRQVLDWLQVECARQNFTVEQREFKQPVRIGPLVLNTRVDRIDRLADGSRAIIDYKTGDAKPSAWSGERPDEPQLPCYAVTATEDVSAVLFGVLRPGDNSYRGYARTEQVAPGIVAFEQEKYPSDGCADWDALLVHWREVLERIAEAFAAGDARVDPKDRNRTCSYCHLASLCRIDETRQTEEADDE
jgi:ATP-dependent helicase/nuclease subunit B